MDSDTIRRGIGPPKKRHTEAWMLLTMMFALAVLLEPGGPSPQRALLIILTIAGASVSQRCLVYNRRELEVRIATWKRSFVCERCGNMFDETLDSRDQRNA